MDFNRNSRDHLIVYMYIYIYISIPTLVSHLDRVTGIHVYIYIYIYVYICRYLSVVFAFVVTDTR